MSDSVNTLSVLFIVMLSAHHTHELFKRKPTALKHNTLYWNVKWIKNRGLN